MKPTILLTGRGGQLGSELNRLLPNLGEVISPDRSELDLRDPEKICRLMRDVQPQLVVNAAAYTAVDAAEADEASAQAVNAEAPQIFALEAKKLGALLVHFSTDYVFDGSKDTPYVESDCPNPLNAYGRTKLAGEEAIRDAGCAHLIFRTSWVYGTRGRNFLLTILRLATEREELKIVDDQTGAPTSAKDLAEATTTILKGIFAGATGANGQLAFPKVTGTYHMTAAGHTTWYEFTKAILEEAARAPRELSWLTAATHGRPIISSRVLPISTQAFGLPARRPSYSVLSNACLLQTFGVTLAEWRTQLQRCFSPERTPVNPSAVLSSC
jgi:dTDP-4-dehydrorhamnose reductase